MQQYSVTGMSCAACSSRVEKAVSKVQGVTSCSVSLLTNSMGVEGNAEPQEIIQAVINAGYGASMKSDSEKGHTEENDSSNEADSLKDTETPKLKKRLAASSAFLMALMYFSMGHMMWNWPLPPFFDGNHIAMGLVQLLLSAAVMVINQRFFISGFKSLLHRAPNMDTLVALGSTASFAYSTYVLFAMTAAQLNGNAGQVMAYMHEFYFESAAMILTLITVGKMLEARSKGKTTDALKKLMQLRPQTATVIREGKEMTIPASQVKAGDVFTVRPGEHIPVDGIIIEGNTSVDESAITGESIPTDKKEGDAVTSATLNQNGFIKCRAEKVGQDTVISQIIKMVSDAAATKAPVAKIADKVSGIFVPSVIAISIITVAAWLLLGKDTGFALARGISVLVISCPCALGLATPVAIMVGNGIGARNGILFKTAASLELAGKVKTVALDKTGTITEGKPVVTDIIPADGFSGHELLSIAFSLEAKSEHPLARAIVKKAEEEKVQASEVSDFKAMAGNGLSGFMPAGESGNRIELLGGRIDFIKNSIAVPDGMIAKAEALSESGKTPMLFSKDGKTAGLIAVADTIKAGSREAIKELQDMGIQVIMITGDNQKTAAEIGRQAGVDRVIAGVLPDGKAKVITELKKSGLTAMTGDGINDAPALTAADTGIAIGAGTDIAIDAADIVLMADSLKAVPLAIKLSRATLKNIKENLFWAFFYNIIGIPLAAGVWIGLTGWKLNPMFGAAAMSLSSFCVVTNALRLNLFKAGRKEIHENNSIKQEESDMEKIMKIEGMMCEHCEDRVKKVLEAIDGVTSAVPSHKEGNAIVTLSKDVSDDILKKAVEDQDYKVLEISTK